jgi:hypothetical protein
MVAPLGILMVMGLDVRRLLMTGHERLTYVSVQAESAVRVGGPMEEVDCKLANLLANLGSTTSGGSPRPYGGARRCLPERPKLILLTPPSLFSTVALGQWPSLLFWHVSLVCSTFFDSP